MKDYNYNPVVRFYLLPYILLSIPAVGLVAVAVKNHISITSNLANILNLDWSNAGILLFASLFLLVGLFYRFTVARLPDLVERTPNKNSQRIRPSKQVFIFSCMLATISGIQLGGALERFERGRSVIDIENLHHVKNLPQHKYFLFKGKAKLISKESFFYFRYTQFAKYKNKEKIAAFYGGQVTSDNEDKNAIFIFISDDALLGGERDQEEEVRVANVALEHLRRDFNKFLDHGGYLALGNIFAEQARSSDLMQIEKSLLACCSKHYGIIEEQSSVGSLFLIFFVIFYLMSQIPIFIDLNKQLDDKKLKVFMNIPSIYEKLFKFRYSIGGIKQYAPDDPTYKAIDYKIKKERDFRYCEKCGAKMKWIALTNKDKTVNKVWGCRNPNCKT